MIEIVSDIVKALNKERLQEGRLLHHHIVDSIEESSFVWRSDYTIAVAKDESKTKVADMMVCSSLNAEVQTFKVKREHDFWKKLDVREEYVAVVECTFLAQETSLCSIEKIGRDIMRSRKEVPSVSELGFVWVVHLPPHENLDKLFGFYFKEDYITLQQDECKYYIGWTERLKGLDMRNFVCNPILKKVENEVVDISTELEYNSKYD